MVDLTGVSASILKFATGGIFWIGIILVGLFIFWLALYLRKQKKLIYTVIEKIPTGNFKVAYKTNKAGWFGKKRMLFGLIDFGVEKSMTLKDGRIIANFSTESLQEFNGKKCIVVTRKHDDPKTLIPISRFKVSEKSQEVIMGVAPGEYRDHAVNIVNMAEKETLSTWEKLMPYLALGAIVIFFIIAVIFASQTFNKSIETSKDLLLKAGDKLTQASQTGQAIPSNQQTNSGTPITNGGTVP